MSTHIIIVGGGPSGCFAALELVRCGYKGKISIIERGNKVEKRDCPKSRVGRCVGCETCNITSGVAGAGAFSDGKLSLNLQDVGGDLPQILGQDTISNLTKYVDNVYLEFGADTKIEGAEETEEVQNIRLKAIQAGLKFVTCPIRHLGTEKSRTLYKNIQDYLISKGVEFITGTRCTDLVVENKKCTGVVIDGTVMHADVVVVATGRSGAEWLQGVCRTHQIESSPSTVDIGVRVECRNEVMEEVNRCLYEGKFVGYPEPFKNRVRTFCQNPGGYVTQENYDGGLAVVNGHSYKEQKSKNTNLSILCSHNFTTPFNQPIEYARKVGELANMLGNSSILVQRFGDILAGKRTWQAELELSNVQPTLSDAVAGDITSAMPYRTMTNIINFIKALDMVVPGFASNETLLYSPELKFYSNKISLDEHLQTNIHNLYCIGDGSGWTRGLMMSSVMGVQVAREILKEE